MKRGHGGVKRLSLRLSMSMNGTGLAGWSEEPEVGLRIGSHSDEVLPWKNL